MQHAEYKASTRGGEEVADTYLTIKTLIKIPHPKIIAMCMHSPLCQTDSNAGGLRLQEG